MGKPPLDDSPLEDALRAARRGLAVLLGLSTALALALAWLLLRPRSVDPRELIELAKADEDVRDAAVAALVEGGRGTWDSHTDPDVGRVLQPRKTGDFSGVPVVANALGMREEPYEAAKPEGVTRIALLGDSYVFGFEVAAEDRVGVFLRGMLAERAPEEAEIECLHLAISSWNVRAECAYVRRQLGTLRPDLVVQVVVVNDLDDLKGVRGFGAMGYYSPQVRERANGLVSGVMHSSLWPNRGPTYMLWGLDHESRERYAAAAHDIARLARAVEAGGGRYLLIVAWEGFNPMARAQLAAGLRDDQVTVVSSEFAQDDRFRIGGNDRHWNRAGHERIATMLYGLIQRRELLPGLQLPVWDAAEAAVREIHRPGVAEARFSDEHSVTLRAKAREQIRPLLDLEELDQLGARQVHGGVDAEGHVAPYASLILRGGGTRLRLRASRLAGPGLEGGTARVLIDEHEVAAFALEGPADVDEAWELPEEVLGREFVTVRFVSDDYLYPVPRSGRCAAFRLRSVSID